MMKILIFSIKEFEISYLEKANQNTFSLVTEKSSLAIETAFKAKGFDAISIFSSDRADAKVLQLLHTYGVKYITLRSAGYDNVDLKVATQLNIKVANVPAYSPYAIAEHTVAMLLTLNRNLIASNNRVSHYNFDINGLTGFDLNGKTVGIIGTGKIGEVMVKIMHGFGCKILAYDLKKNQKLIDQYQVNYTTLEALCAKSDVISLHVPLNPHTHHLINELLLLSMKPNVILLNTARGAVIDTEALIAALEAKQIKAVGLDVYEFEKGIFFKDHSNAKEKDEQLLKLIAMPNVIVSSHHAFLTDEALTNIAETTISNLTAFDATGTCKNQLN